MAIAARTKVRVRLPNSIAECRSSAPCGVNDSSVQRGHVGQPRPEPVSRTAPPVTTRAELATRVAQPSATRGASGTRHSHVNVLAVRRVPSAAQAEQHGEAGPVDGAVDQGGAHRVAERPGRQPADDLAEGAVRRGRQHHGAAGEEQQVDQVGGGEGRLGAQHAGEEQAERGEGGGAQRRRPGRRRASRSAGLPSPAPGPPAPMTSDLERLDERASAPHLAEQQAVAGQRGGAEPLDHAVAALEPGHDRQRRERGRHHGQGEDARSEHVDGGRGRSRCRGARRRAPPPTSTSTGITTASSSCSPLRSISRVSMAAACGEAPGRGEAERGAPRRSAEDVLEGAGSGLGSTPPAPAGPWQVSVADR